MKKEEIIKEIFNSLMAKGKASEKADILGIDTMEDKVFTKRLEVNKKVGSVKVVYVTITSNEKDFSDASENNMRINTKNQFDAWINMFANEADNNMLSKIYEAVK